MNRTCACVAAALLGLAVVAPALAHEVVLKDLEIVHPNTVEMAVGAKDMIVIFTVHNHGATADRLIEAKSELADKVELIDASGGVTSAIDLPAGGTVVLKRNGGPHIVLHDVKQEMAGYATFPLSLTFQNAGKVDAEVLVEDNEDAMTGHPEASPTEGEHP